MRSRTLDFLSTGLAMLGLAACQVPDTGEPFGEEHGPTGSASGSTVQEPTREADGGEADGSGTDTGSDGTEGPTEPPPCGDDVCESGEDCGSCAEDCGGCPDQDAAIITGPWLQAATEDSIVIMWETDAAVPGVVEFGESEALGTTLVSSPTVVAPAHCDPACPDYGDGMDPEDSEAILHEVKLSGLDAGRNYHYRVRMGAIESEPFTFHTHASNGPYRFVHVTDLHFFAIQSQRDRLEVVKSLDPQFVLMSGDLVQTSTNDEFRRFMQGAQESTGKANWYMSRGNHENRPWSTFADWYHNEFPGHLDEDYYAFELGDILFVGINTEPAKLDLFPVQWLTDTLEGSSAKWKVVFAKKPPWKRTYLFDLLEQGDVDLVVSGYCTESHEPEKIGGIWYTPACSQDIAGARLIETGDEAWTVTEYSRYGDVRWEVTVEK